ncbi:hypothetical protein ACFQ0G_51745 [Streptomyces chiangmaiensis]
MDQSELVKDAPGHPQVDRVDRCGGNLDADLRRPGSATGTSTVSIDWGPDGTRTTARRDVI